jgi:F-type H+-transporting ATPase subunit delta
LAAGRRGFCRHALHLLECRGNNAARRRPDLLRLAAKYVTNPRASGGMPPEGVALSKCARNFQAPRARKDNGDDDRGNIGGFLRVASKHAGVSGLADRYATALFELADERKSLDQVADDLRQVRAMLADSADLRRLMRSPILSRADQGRAIAAVADGAGLTPLTHSFLGLVARNRRLFAVPPMIDAYLARLAARRGEVTAEIVAAQALTPAQLDAVNEQLRKAMGSKVAVEVRVDPALLGGLVVKVGSRMVDASLRSKLHRLQLAMKGA